MKTNFLTLLSAAVFSVLIASPVFAQQKTAKACRDEWKVGKSDFQAKGINEKAYVADCRAGTNAIQPAAAPTTAAPPVTTAKPPVMPTVTPPATKQTQAPAPKPTATAAPAPAGANEFTTEAMAKAHCPSDIVVWANHKSKIYHYKGTTKDGGYMCEKDSVAAGYRANKNQKRPST